MIKITIEGPQGSGKTKMAEFIRAGAKIAGSKVFVFDEETANDLIGFPEEADVVVITRQGGV